MLRVPFLVLRVIRCCFWYCFCSYGYLVRSGIFFGNGSGSAPFLLLLSTGTYSRRWFDPTFSAVKVSAPWSTFSAVTGTFLAVPDAFSAVVGTLFLSRVPFWQL